MRIPVYVIHWNSPEWLSSAVKTILASEGVQVDLTIIDNFFGALPFAAILTP